MSRGLSESDDESISRAGGKPQDVDACSAGSFSEVESRFIDHETVLSLHNASCGDPRMKWKFVWNGFRISGYVFDEDFLRKFEKGEIPLEEGGAFNATLRAHQVRDRISGNWLNKRYEVLKVSQLIE